MSIFNPELKEFRESNFEANKFSRDTEKRLLKALEDKKERYADIVQCPNKSCGVPVKVEMQGDHVRVSCPTCGWETVLRRDVRTHEMKLNEEPFKQIENGKKRYELRLNDEKRKGVRLGDHIVFSKLPELNEKLEVEVIALEKYPSFQDMYKALKADFSDYSEDEFVEGMYKYYSPEDEQKYGALAIGIKLIS